MNLASPPIVKTGDNEAGEQEYVAKRDHQKCQRVRIRTAGIMAVARAIDRWLKLDPRLDGLRRRPALPRPVAAHCADALTGFGDCRRAKA